MKKIVYLCSTLEQTGPTSQLFNIIKGLNRELFHPCVVTLSPEKDKSLKIKFEEAGIDIFCLSSYPNEKIKILAKSFYDFLNDNRVDIVHSQGIRSDYIMSKLINKTTVNWVATLRNIPYLDYPPQYGKIRGYAMALSHITFLKKCKNIVVVSQSVKEALGNLFGKEIYAIPNGIDTEFYSNDSVFPENYQKSTSGLFLKENDKVLVYTGVFEERKNLRLILDSIDKTENFKILLVGSGSQYSMISNHPAVKNNKAILVGAVKDVRPFILSADAFILLSKAEGLPNSVLEALSLDRPVILSDIGPHREIHALSSGCSHLIDIKDEEALSTFLNEDFDKWKGNIMSGESRMVVERNFSSTVNSLSYQKLY